MIQFNIWLSHKADSFRYKGKRYTLNSECCELKKMIDWIRYIITVILMVLSYFCVDKGNVVYVAAGIAMIVDVLSLFVYMAKFPDNLEKVI